MLIEKFHYSDTAQQFQKAIVTPKCTLPPCTLPSGTLCAASTRKNCNT